MERISVTRFRDQMAFPLNRVAFGKERIVLQRQERDLVAVVPLEDLELLEALKDEGLIALADQAEAEARGRPVIPLEQIKQQSERLP